MFHSPRPRFGRKFLEKMRLQMRSVLAGAGLSHPLTTPSSLRPSSRFVASALFLAAVLALLTGWAPPLSADHPNQPQGFSPERSYQLGLAGIDQVDLYSGRLSLTVPLGPFTLFYNSNVWRYENVVENDSVRVKAIPDRLTTAGLGWHLGWGELYHANHWYNPSETGQWMYVGRDGKQHVFYDRMHYDDDPDGDTNVHYTRDNSYLRLRRVSTWVYDIEFPDGTTRRFANQGSLSSKPFRLVSSWSSVASQTDPDMTVSYNSDDTLRTVQDRHGRNHYIHLAKGNDIIDGHPLSWMIRAITQIDVEGFGGARNLYDLEYRNILVDVSCKDTSSSTPSRIRVPHLSEIQMADGTAYTMLDGATPAYYNSCQGNLDDVPGALKRIDLPTGGALRWTFQRFEFPPGDNHSVFNTAAGVATREMIEADGTVSGTWTYKTRNFGTGESGRGGFRTKSDPEMRLDVVVLPEGDCTRHYFNAIYYVLPSQQRGWELGLPFTYTHSSGGKYLSTEAYASNNGAGLCSGTKLRSTYLRYRKDTTPGCVFDPKTSPNCARQSAFYDSNRTVEASRVVFHDDGDRYIDSERSDFDGLGNFRESETTGNLWALSTSLERRHSKTGFNRITGTYGQANYAPPATTTPWLLGLYDSTEVTEDDAIGETISRAEYSMDPNNGTLSCMRQLKSGTQRSADDLLTTYAYDNLGLVTDVKLYGSDLQGLPLSGSGCGNLPSGNPLYWTNNTYQYGALKTSRPMQPNGTAGSFFTYDVDLDPSTALVTTRRDSAGFATNLLYDSLGRVTDISPQSGAVVSIDYDNAIGTTAAKVTTTVEAPQGFLTYGKKETVFDSFGRGVLQRVRRPLNVWSEKETVLNARGWTLSVSQWGNLNLKTQFLEHDPFGRPGRIRPADGATHDVLMSYQGVRKATSTAKVQKAIGAAESSQTKEVEYDRYGRLRRVREGAGTNGAMVPTVYHYDVGSRLTRIFQGGSPQQMRRIDFDNRGFMTRERHPEKGSVGNGWVNYFGYDPLGNANRVLDGPNDRGFTFDYAGRMTQIFDRNRQNRPVTAISYDSGAGFGNGKVWKAARFNYLDLPWIEGAEETVKVEHIYNYQGVGGAVSQKDTIYGWPGSFERFRQNVQYDQAGQLDTFTYPRCTTPACAGTSAATSQTLSYNYSQGLLTSLPGWIDAIDYFNDGSWSQIHHSNGVVDHRERHPQLLTKTRRLWTSGPPQSVPQYDSGIMNYDGSGNIKTMGSSAFAYDSVNRLVDANFPDWSIAQGYDYDVFGNLLERSTTLGSDTTTETFPVNPATNRMTSGVTYDAAGNVTSQQVDFNYQFSYDTENNLVSQAWMRYLYDAADQRAGAVANTPQHNVRFDLRDLGGNLVSEISYFNGEYERQEDSIYAGSRLVALTKPNGYRRHYHSDHLSTPRQLTAADGTIERQPFFLPYGEEIPYEDSFDKRKLGGHERDFSTGTDYMRARHYYSESGRFMSVDPLRGDSSEPQTLNRYSYVTGNPINYYDPTGLFKGDEDDPFEGTITVTASDPCGRCGGGFAIPGANGGRGGTSGGRGRGGSGNGGTAGVPGTPNPPTTPGSPGPENPEIPGPNLDLTIPLLDVSRARDFYQNIIRSSDNVAAMGLLQTLLDLMPATQADLNRELAFAVIPPLGVARLLPAVGRTFRLTQQGLEHIALRHFASSGATNAGKFAVGTTARNLRSMIGQTIENGAVRSNTFGRPGHIFEHNFGRQIGVNRAGDPSSSLRVVRNLDGTIKTAFPF